MKTQILKNPQTNKNKTYFILNHQNKQKSNLNIIQVQMEQLANHLLRKFYL
jgi:hypothetical protein